MQWRAVERGKLSLGHGLEKMKSSRWALKKVISSFFLGVYARRMDFLKSRPASRRFSSRRSKK
jgi:hypothetical protein